MTQPERKYGRRAPKNAPAIRLGNILRSGAAVPAHPASEDYLSQLSDWQMLGNDQAGDCVAVTWANMRRLVTRFLASEDYPTQEQVWKVYKTQNPDFDPNGTADTNGPGSSADQGMDIQTLLEYLTKHGGPDGSKPIAFAKVDHTNPQELDAALAIFGGVWTGVNVLQVNMDEFDAGEPWDYIPGSPLDGGHSVLAGGYTPNVRFITWGQETEFTPTFVEHLVEETWVVVWPEMLGSKAFLDGVDVAALAADYKALTGRDFPVPAPDPVPTPVPVPPPVPDPVPVPDDADVTFAGQLRHFVQHPWLYSQHRIAADAKKWLKAKGL